MAAKKKKPTTAKKKAPARKKGPAKALARAKAAVKKAAKQVTAKLSPSAGMTVEAWIAKKMSPEQAPIARELLALLREVAPDATSSIKWGQPVFEANGPLAYFRGSAKHVTFGFWRGQQLSDPSGLLEGEGDRMKHLKIKDVASLPRDAIRGWIREAIALNQQQGSPTMRGG